jgi:hypothetical protein
LRDQGPLDGSIELAPQSTGQRRRRLQQRAGDLCVVMDELFFRRSRLEGPVSNFGRQQSSLFSLLANRCTDGSFNQ